MQLEIVKRLKDVRGNIVAYEIRDLSDNGKGTQIMLKDKAESLEKYVSNAFIKGNLGYVARPGCHIDTSVDTSSLGVSARKKKVAGSEDTVTGYAVEYRGQKFINICRKIREAAVNDKIIIDKSEHKDNEGRNVRLFDLIEACGADVDSFVKGYLAELQPYYIEKFNVVVVEPNKDDAFLVDTGYGVELVIKIQNLNSKNETVLISFHESSDKNGYILNKRSSIKDDEYCVVICDDIGEKECNRFSIKYTVQRGFIRQQLSGRTAYISKDAALVKYSDIKSVFDDSLGQIKDTLVEMYYDSENNSSVTFSTRKSDRVSFMSFGHADVNNLSFLIEVFEATHKKTHKQIIADVAVGLFEELSPSRKLDVVTALEKRVGLENDYVLFRYLSNRNVKLISD